MRPLLVPLLVLVAACRGPAGATATDGTSTTSTTSTTGDASSTTDACERSGDCDTEGTDGAICVAGYVMADTLGGDRTPSTCVDPSLCIQALDLARWCFDHQGCCEGLRCRAVDGICEDPYLGQDTSGTSTSGTDTSGTSTSGTDTSSTDTSGTSTSGTDTSGTTDPTGTSG